MVDSKLLGTKHPMLMRSTDGQHVIHFKEENYLVPSEDYSWELVGGENRQMLPFWKQN